MRDNSLTTRQKEILDFIISEQNYKGYPPSIREIGSHVGLNSSSTVHNHLAALEDKGYIRRDPSKPRAIEITREPASVKEPSAKKAGTIYLPVIGQIAAGNPLAAFEDYRETIELPKSFAASGNCFILIVKGDSMTGAGILSDDMVIVRRQETAENGDIVVVLLDGDATLKYYYREKDFIRLQPGNPDHDPIYTSDAKILGLAVSLIRKF